MVHSERDGKTKRVKLLGKGASGEGDKVVVEFTYRALLDKNDRILATYKDTELEHTHPGAPMPTAQLGTATACLEDCLTRLSQDSHAGGEPNSPQVVATG
jgi:hypothetical protein